MKMAKASLEDIEMTLELCLSLECLEKGYLPAALAGEDEESPIWYDEDEDGDRVVQHLLAILRKGSAFRVAFGMAVLLDPRNEVVDPDSDCLEMHPRFAAAMEDAERYRYLRGDEGPTSTRWPRWDVRHWNGVWNTVHGEEMDAAVDAAMTPQGESRI